MLTSGVSEVTVTVSDAGADLEGDGHVQVLVRIEADRRFRLGEAGRLHRDLVRTGSETQEPEASGSIGGRGRRSLGGQVEERDLRLRDRGATGIFDRALDVAGELSRSGARQQQERDEHLDEQGSDQRGTSRYHVEPRHIHPQREIARPPPCTLTP